MHHGWSNLLAWGSKQWWENFGTLRSFIVGMLMSTIGRGPPSLNLGTLSQLYRFIRLSPECFLWPPPKIDYEWDTDWLPNDCEEPVSRIKLQCTNRDSSSGTSWRIRNLGSLWLESRDPRGFITGLFRILDVSWSTIFPAIHPLSRLVVFFSHSVVACLKPFV